MNDPGPYDLVAILAGDKPARHRPATELLRRGWGRHITVTGEHEHIDETADLAGRVLSAPPSRSTYEDALSVLALVREHRFRVVLVVTSAVQVPRARLVFGTVLGDLPVTVDILSWEQVSGRDRSAALRVLRAQLTEALKLFYYMLRGRI